MFVVFDWWCFYVLIYDRWEDIELQVFFFKFGNNINNWIFRYQVGVYVFIFGLFLLI